MRQPRSAVDGLAEPEIPDAPRESTRRRWAVAMVAAVLTALALTAFISYRLGSAGTPAALPTASPEPTAPEELSTAEVYEAVAPSVVTIEAQGSGTTGSTGTGVVASADGTILTAFHVVRGARAIRVTFADGTTSPARLVSSDPAQDIAALAPADLPSVLVPAVLGNSGRLAVGDGVVAVGNQLGLTSSATGGVVSGMNRSANGTGGLKLTGLIQFDAAVNPGSSGGPLVNARGETIGIVVALANPTDAETFIGIGFAVPIGSAVAAGGGPGPQQ